MGEIPANNPITTRLFERFNRREAEAFSEVYSLVYNEVYYYTHSFYKNTQVDPKDIIQDIFCDIWQDHRNRFENLSALKSFIYIVIRNRYIKYVKHRRCVDRTFESILRENSKIYAIEAEVFSIIPQVLDILPEECARTFKLFLEGYDAKEIACKVGKRLSTVYNQRSDAITILKQKLSRDKLMLLLMIVKGM